MLCMCHLIIVITNSKIVSHHIKKTGLEFSVELFGLKAVCASVARTSPTLSRHSMAKCGESHTTRVQNSPVHEILDQCEWSPCEKNRTR